jgi:filamentous hemagglutinin family protein
MKNYRNKQSAHPQWLSGTRQPLRRALNLAILAILYPSFAQANPDGAQVVSGQVSIDTATPGVTTITNSPNAIINWQNFSIGQNELTQFIQQNSQSAVLNRIIGQNPSEILGQLTSNGKVFLINPNGVVFGPGSMVDTQGLVASSLNLSDQDFLSGNYHFMAGASAGSIVNEGIIRAGKDGNIVLIAPQIDNNGIIRTEGGSITLAAGQELTITSLDDPEIRFQIQAPADQVLNIGKLLAEGGAINVFAGTIKHSGEINADSVEVDQQGNIRLVAQHNISLASGSKISADNNQGDAGSIHIDSQGGTTLAQGTITAKAVETGSSTQLTTGKGGNIELLGEQVAVQDKAVVNASGQNGGGQVLVGGDYQGKNQAVHNAKTTEIGQHAVIKANAKTAGDGGKIIAWSDETTRVHGTLNATGGSQGGNGGFIETSGSWLDTAGIKVDASSPHGQGGEWLLDPYNISIVSDLVDVVAVSNPFASSSVWTATSNTSYIRNSAINTQLNNGTSITIYTGGASGSEAGNITVASNISKTSGGDATLHLKADNSVIVSDNISISSTSNKLNTILNADTDTDNAGNIQMGAGSSISSNGGNIIMGGGTCNSAGCTSSATGYAYVTGQREGIYLNGASGNFVSLDSSGGKISLSGTGLSTSGSGQYDYGVFLNYASFDTDGGALIITGNGGGTGNWSINEGIHAENSTLSSNAGNLTLSATGGNGNGGDNGIDLISTSITTTSGTIQLDGMGGNSSGSGNYGIQTYLTTITSTTGNIILNGTGGNATNNNAGIYLYDTDLTATNGAMTITGTGQGSGTGNYGIETYNVTLTSGSGNLTLDGTGGNGTDNNQGVSLDETELTAANGLLSISGTGQGSGFGNYGISIYNTTITGDSCGISINGTGANGTLGNLGVYFELNTISTADGPINITGIGQGSGINNFGIKSFDTTFASDSGSITLDGRGAGSALGLNINAGTIIGANTGQTGDITLIADTATGSDSIMITAGEGAAPKIQSSGTLTLKPLNNTATIGLAGGTGTFNLSATELGYIENIFSSIIIGKSTGTGLINMGASGWTVPSLSNLTLQNTGVSSNGITVNGTLTVNNSKALTLSTKGSITNNAAINGGTVNLIAATGISQYADISAYGNITLTANNNSGTGNFIQNGGLISNSDTGAPGNITINAYDIQIGATDSKHNVILNAAHDIHILAKGFIGGGTAQNFHVDDQSFAYTLPFGFTFYGVPYTTMYVSSNGLITFGNGTQGYNSYVNSNTALMAGVQDINSIHRPTIAPAWSDWVTYSNLGKDIYIHQPTNNTLAVRWDVANYGDNSYTADFEAVLSQQGSIAFNYGTATTMNPSYTATIGVSKGDNVHYTLSSLNNPSSLNDLSSILFNYDASSGNYLESFTSSSGNISAISDVSLYAARFMNINAPITAATINAQSDNDIILGTMTTLTTSGTGNAIVLSAGAGDFINYAGASVLNAGSGRWLIYSTSPTLNTSGGLTSGNSNLWSKTYANYSPASVVETGNRYLFSQIDPVIAAANKAAQEAAAKAAQEAAEKAAKEAAEKAAQEAAEKAAQEAAEKAAKEAAEKAAQEAAEKAAKEAAEKAAQEAAEKAAKEAAEKAAQEAAEKAAKEAAEKAAQEAAKKAAKEAAEKNQIPDLLDDESTPTEETLEETLDQVTTVVTSTQNQSNNSSTTNTENNGNPTTSDNGTTNTTGSSSGKKDNSGKQCTK